MNQVNKTNAKISNNQVIIFGLLQIENLLQSPRVPFPGSPLLPAPTFFFPPCILLCYSGFPLAVQRALSPSSANTSWGSMPPCLFACVCSSLLPPATTSSGLEEVRAHRTWWPVIWGTLQEALREAEAGRCCFPPTHHFFSLFYTFLPAPSSLIHLSKTHRPSMNVLAFHSMTKCLRLSI